uniref:SET domain-containing protein n=1 Tax=Trypanosoma congolense (strain IL3000) TaxID=1068625 RepID=G0UW52_TRYCI|nr:conserved hypothetical protein [Trypanosoma congolense IL3000]
MIKADVVAVFCDAEHEETIRALLGALVRFPFKLFPVRNGPSMYHMVRTFCASRDSYRCALNLCTGSTEDSNLASPVVLASLFEHTGIPYGGCRYTTLKQPLDTLFMMTFYAGLPLPRFMVIKTGDKPECPDLRLPVRLRNADPLQGSFDVVVESKYALMNSLREGLRSHGKLVAWEVSSAGDAELRVLVWGSGNHAVVAEPLKDHADPLAKTLDPPLQKWASSFSKNVLDNCGFAQLHFNVNPHTQKIILENIEIGCSLIELCTKLSSIASEEGLLNTCVRESESVGTAPVAEVCFGGEHKGYYLIATRDISKGELVFRDEERSFSLVTRPFVKKHWDEEKKQLFREYAWPIDSDGHVYATWDNDPNCWRPINHSCEPNCIFDEDHSLNVIASRPITKGEELTMDYSTFCDHTMKPFSCFCGASSCRELVVPDEASLKNYGTNTWHRRPPVPHADNI